MSQAHEPGTGGGRPSRTDVMLRWATAVPPDDQLCGRRESAGWHTVFLSPRGTAVLAQLDLTGY